jgi:hypothetical protein
MSKTTKFTPGPWTTTATGDHIYQRDGERFGPFICSVAHNKTERLAPHKSANANLICASPGLYEALEKSLHVFSVMLNFGEKVEEESLQGMEGCLWPVEEIREQIKQIEAALAAARGETK